MKNTIKVLAVIAGLGFYAASCEDENGNPKAADSAASMIEHPMTPTTDSNRNEQAFIDYVVPKNTKEIILLQAAIDKGSSKEIKDHAKMMLKDHKKMESDVQGYLSKNPNFKIPAVDTSGVTDLKEKPGKDWDKAWTKKMVDEHEDLLKKLEKSQKDVKDTALLTIINGAVPVVKSHLDMAKMTKEKM